MDLDEAWEEVRRILDADLDVLTEGGRLSAPPPVAEHAWDLPEGDLRTLWSYGLPPPRTDGLMGVVREYQATSHPELLDAGLRYYSLGSFGAARLAARQKSGEVLAFPDFSYEELHPTIQQMYPDGVRPELVNSSVARLVDLSWRWHWLVPVLADQQVQAGRVEHAAGKAMMETGKLVPRPDFFAGVRALSGSVVERFSLLDPAALADEDSFWHETVMETL